MDEEVQKRLFEPFVTHSEERGTGLGMCVVKNIVEAHDGKLTYTSEKGKGTTFRIACPLRGSGSGSLGSGGHGTRSRLPLTDPAAFCTYCSQKPFPGSVTVAQKTLDLFVGVRILPGKRRRVTSGDGPFVYRLGHEILNLKRGVRFP